MQRHLSEDDVKEMDGAYEISEARKKNRRTAINTSVEPGKDRRTFDRRKEDRNEDD